ncbi:S8 family serine peptidase [Amycolatopsis aidingensis]|uniref:S8 family serine peptidase n=1 Tax=Amycolatopsis aidingensis TaxID=2842453 RepID=UPI001C0CF524|nr:S8 family serine peptidase [Amycolatopsis aidingensis]
MIRQIAALQQLKRAQSAVEAKVDSRLLLEQRRRGGRMTSSALSTLHTGVEVSRSGAVTVDIRADKVSGELLAAIRAAGGSTRTVSRRLGSVRAELPLPAVSTVARRAEVRAVELATEAMTNREQAPGQGPAGAARAESKEDTARRVDAELRAALGARAQTVTSEGDRTHNVDTARLRYGVTGVGTKICALSDGVASLAASQARGELPDVDVLPGQAGSGDEGTAMLEILHDLAPGAELGFATAFGSDAGFADNIRALRFDAGCDVIVDDVLYFKESPFQDWIIAQAVNEVTAHGALYFSSAGNQGNTLDGTAGHWEGDFVDSGQQAGKFAGAAHDFAGADGTQIFQPISEHSPGSLPVTLFWSDPLGGASSDYDLYLFDGAGNLVAMSQDTQNGTQDPYERLNTPVFGGSGLRLAVVKYSGADRYLSLSALRGRFSDSADGLRAYTTPGATFGHSAARNAVSVAATPAAAPFGRPLEPGDPPNPAGPFPGSFGGASKLERFTADGPRRVFYQADGTPITPGDVSSTGGELRQKPEVTAADGVRTSVSGFDPFFGTSAAAPHAAAIAALVLSGNPGLPAAEVREALLRTAVDIGPQGTDGVSGAGVLLADRVLAYTGATPQPVAGAQAPTVTPDGSDYLEPGGTATVRLPVRNEGDGPAVSTSVVLTSPTPGVTVSPRARAYGTISQGQTVANDFTVSVPAAHEPGAPVELRARVTFVGRYSPTTASFPIPVGRPSDEVRDFAYTGAAVPIPDDDAEGISVPLEVAEVGWAARLSVSVDGTECGTDPESTTVGINHSYVGDLVGTLTAPSGRSATLFQRNGASGNNLCQVVFTDDAERSFDSVSSAEAPFTGSFRGASPLRSLLTEPVDGTWTLHVADLAGADTGSLRSVSLHINGYVRPEAQQERPAQPRREVRNGPVRPL